MIIREIPWYGHHCILCLNIDNFSKEHLIPEQIGGVLWSKFLCKKCNDLIGYRIEADLKRDPTIRLAIESLSSKVPNLYEKMRNNLGYIAKSKDGVLKGRFNKNGVFRVNTYMKKDGSIIQPTDDAKAHLEKTLRKRGADDKEIKGKLTRIDEAPLNTLVKIDDTMRIKKWDIDSIEPDLSGELIGYGLPLKIGYEFLASCVGSSIYNRNLNDIREAILNKKVFPETYKVEHLRSDYSEPIHGIVLEKKLPHVMIQIRLFGLIAYRVHFLRLGIDGDNKRVIYTLDLKEQEEYLSYLE